jgi:hypothetical protein
MNLGKRTKKFKLKRRFGGKSYKFVGSRGSKKDANRYADNARSRGKKVRVVKRGETGAKYEIYERG